MSTTRLHHVLAFALAALCLPAGANDALWALLEKGGQVVLIRHG
jgi:hypothetical protein